MTLPKQLAVPRLIGELTPPDNDPTHIGLSRLEHHWLVKVSEGGYGVWRVLCLECRNRYVGFKRVSLSRKPCEQCGAVYAEL